GALGDSVRWRHSLALGGLVLLGIAVFGLDQTLRFPGWWALLPVAAAVMLILAGPPAWPDRYVLSTPPLVLTGLLTYPPYLWHCPLLSLARIIAPPELPGATIAGLVAVAFALAWLTYSLVELPIRRPRTHLPATRAAPILALLMAAIGLL